MRLIARRASHPEDARRVWRKACVRNTRIRLDTVLSRNSNRILQVLHSYSHYADLR